MDQDVILLNLLSTGKDNFVQKQHDLTVTG